MSNPFEITYEDDLYFDMALCFSVDDELRTGGNLVITIEKKTGKTYAVLTGNDESGAEIFYSGDLDVPKKWAATLAKATIKAKGG